MFPCRAVCQSVCHKKCLSSVVNQCSVPGDDVEYILEVNLSLSLTLTLTHPLSLSLSPSLHALQICPEVGLTAQQFRCVRCNRQLTQTPPAEVRLCDYDGRYYCPDCHSNDMALIPARVMHNWDFTTRPVSYPSASVRQRFIHDIYCLQ